MYTVYAYAYSNSPKKDRNGQLLTFPTYSYISMSGLCPVPTCSNSFQAPCWRWWCCTSRSQPPGSPPFPRTPRPRPCRPTWPSRRLGCLGRRWNGRHNGSSKGRRWWKGDWRSSLISQVWSEWHITLYHVTRCDTYLYQYHVRCFRDILAQHFATMK